jgi:hypothetical protein
MDDNNACNHRYTEWLEIYDKVGGVPLGEEAEICKLCGEQLQTQQLEASQCLK